METNLLLALTQVLLFSLGCRYLIHAISTPVPIYNRTHFSKRALRISKTYKIFSWSSLNLLFLYGMVISFVEVLSQI